MDWMISYIYLLLPYPRRPLQDGLGGDVGHARVEEVRWLGCGERFRAWCWGNKSRTL